MESTLPKQESILTKQESTLIRVGALQGYLDLTESLACDPTPLLNQLDLSVALLNNPEERIPFSTYETLLEQSAKTFKVADFGMRLGSQQDIFLLGPVGLLLLQCSSVQEAITYAQNYVSLHVLAEYWETSSEQHVLTITRHQHQRYPHSVGHAVELSLAACFSVLKQLGGNDLKLMQVRFAHRPISDTKTYADVFNCPVLFNQDKDQIILDQAYLGRRIDKANEPALLSIKNTMDRELQAINNISRQVKSMMLASLGTANPMLERIAATLNLHPRTLQRRLETEGHQFKSLLIDTRMETAQWILSNSNMSLTQLSDRLGYNELSAFSKAFKKYCGLSPREWRRQSS